ncbi:MAG: hypothetical protein JNL74_06795 [Fibrobacteres bacterium]|nr:hypothetical protein [Fibrobacterota bacterium]
MPAVKICIIGGGSAYMTSMFGTIARYVRDGGLAGSEVVLTDIEEKSVKTMTEWGNAGAKNDGLKLKFSYDMNLERALTGSDFVLSCIRPGGLDSRFLDETIPVKYGELGNETVGVGGVFMALRTIPHVVKIAEAIQKKCPNAWLVNYTNPTNMVCDASVRAGHKKTLGLCDGVWGVKWLCAKLLKIPTTRAHEIDAYVSGVNHHTWALRLEHKGKDLYKIMDKLIANTDLRGKAGYEPIDTNPLLNEVEADCCRLYKQFGILPGTVYYSRYYYAYKKLMGHYLDPKHEFRSQWLKNMRAEKLKDIAKQMKTGRPTLVPHDLEDAAHGDQAIGAIHGIATDAKFLEAVIVQNNGAVPSLPKDAQVEVTCRMTKNGPKAVAVPPLPLAVDGMVRDAYIFGKLSVDAAMTGDKRLVYQAAMAHPAHRDLDVITKVIEDLFKAHKKYLPQFNGKK